MVKLQGSLTVGENAFKYTSGGEVRLYRTTVWTKRTIEKRGQNKKKKKKNTHKWSYLQISEWRNNFFQRERIFKLYHYFAHLDSWLRDRLICNTC